MAEFCSQYIPILYCLNILTSQTLSSNVDVKVDVQLEAQFINLTLSMDLNKLFADLPSKYADLVEISRLKVWPFSIRTTVIFNFQVGEIIKADIFKEIGVFSQYFRCF